MRLAQTQRQCEFDSRSEHQGHLAEQADALGLNPGVFGRESSILSMATNL